MRFDYLNLRAFGHFTDYELHFDQMKNFHLIYGPNEAGKSTTLRSITHFLYGFPQQTNDSFLHSNTKLRIEGQLKKSTGECLQFVRRKGNKNTILDVDGTSLDENVVNHFLQGISEEHFLNMFALDHVRLREGGESLLQSGGNLGESLFSAASGINILRKVFEDLDKKSGELYKKRGSTPEINKLLKEEKELKKQISEYQLKIQAWKDLERRYTDGKSEIDTISKEVRELRGKQDKLQRLKLTLPKIAKREDLRQKLEELGQLPTMPENFADIRKDSQQKLNLASIDKKKAENEQRDLQLEIDKITIPTGILEQATTINSLYREVQSYQNQVNQVPRLEGEIGILEERVLAVMKEIDPSNAELEYIDTFRITSEKKETIRELCKEKPLLDQTLQEYTKERSEIEEELINKRNVLESLPELPNTEELEDVIDQVKRAGNIEETITQLISELNQKELQIEEEVTLLPQWSGSYHELMKLEVAILTETINKYEQEQTRLTKMLDKVKNQLSTQKELIEGHEEKIRELDALAEIPSEEILVNARTQRDQEWQSIYSKLKNWNTHTSTQMSMWEESSESTFEKSMRNADSIADKMRFEAAKVGEKNKRLSDIDSCKKKVQEIELVKKGLLEDIKGWETSWRELWKPTTITPLTPAEMKEWISKFQFIKVLVKENEKIKQSIKDLESKKEQLNNTLKLSVSLFTKVSSEKSLTEILSIAERQYKNILEVEAKRNRLIEGISEINRRLNTNEQKVNDLKRKISYWNKDWDEVILNTNISSNISVKVAESLLSKYEDCSKTYEEFKRVEKDLKAVKIQISQFENSVSSLLHLVDIKMELENTDLIVNHLYAALQKAQTDRTELTNLEKQLKRLRDIIRNAEEEIENANSVINGLLHTADCQEVHELENLEKRFLLKENYMKDIRAIEEELLLNGNGLSLHDVLEESKEANHDQLGIQIEEIVQKLEEIEPLRSQMEQNYGVVKKEYEEKVQGNSISSVTAEQNKTSLLTKLANVTDQYVNLKLASLLLQRGIEHYRNQNQDPILSRASELFARLTLQSFSGLQVDYDEKDQPVLMGIRSNGDKVPVEGMSDGSTDQLYLALRIASIEKYASENEPMPFIVDDILVHFDDIRAKETLKILLELSNHTQIIFFTHHSRLVEIMNEIALDTEYQLKEINGKEALTV